MPELPQQRPIKGLNKGPGQKRFVFKTFSQRVEEVDLDVFRSLAPLKVEPSGGTSFFHESLVSWRELNSAVEFTSVYEQLLPVVQTLPQLILHKQLIMNTLMSHLKLSAIHSLEPILSLIAILSRDLRSDFIFFIPQFLGACVDLFQSGGDREPEIIEQSMKDVLTNKGLSELLKERSEDDDYTQAQWDLLDAKAMATIRLHLAESVFFTIIGKTTAKDLWDSLCSAWESKSASNKVFLMEKLMKLCMKEGSTVFGHLNEFNSLFSQLTS
ncbi:hypothetical protein L7F22_014606 [Adiantum nelumboides]|nr:hypothetical protein [Adiantum nelumboides]